ncbi:PE domain-containing protein [Mycobacterium sp.]|uniref:PE domain-containing protein n=1 Tax=Mycobacterium sp. TaxID=1785 RepID=UPI002C146BA7|nr:PE domain-containing protein [Mycobacterium sp.]HTY33244.1 PE domain-containing protein [Mycobacterium sp.]
MPSLVIAAPEALAAASADLTGIEEAIKAASAAAAPSTTGIAAAGADEVSAAVASLFGDFAEEFHTLTAQTTLFHSQFVGTLSAAGATYVAGELTNVSLLVKGVEQQFFDVGFFSPFTYLTGQPLFGQGAVGPAVTGTTGPGLAGRLITGFLNGTLGSQSGGVFQGTGTPGPVTGVREGMSYLEIPVGPHGYDAPARWYFPTQADGSVNARGVIYLQHGFLGTGGWYGSLAIALAYGTDSIVVVPTVSSIPLPMGAWLGGTQMQQAVGSLFLGNETALNLSASQAGYHGTLPQSFMITGHSAGGGLATLAAGDYIADLGTNTANNHLLGVVMFDGVASDSSAFAAAIANLKTLNIPDYVVASPPQPWNAFGATTNELVSLYPGQFTGVELVNGSHVDSLLGNKPVIDFVAQLFTSFSPGGNTAAVYTLSTGWINDIYAGHGPLSPLYGLYGTTGGYVPPGGQQITLGPATGTVLPV